MAAVAIHQPWTEHAECRGSTPLFFPDKHIGGDSFGVAAARATCSKCPVSAECLEWALTGGPEGTGEHFGVWGGTTPRERRAIRRGRMRPSYLRAVS